MNYTSSRLDVELPKGRRRLMTVLRSAGPTISIGDAASALKVDRGRAALLLSRWVGQGFLRRIRHGLYVPVMLDAAPSETAVEDPWILVPRLFAPGYIAGWSAAEHWELTEQIFNDICVFTTRSLRSRVWKLPGVTFVAKHIREQSLFGLKQIWRGSTRVPVSDPHKTIVDMLDDPSVGGGISHVAHCFAAYLRSEESNPDTLIDYAKKLGNGAVFKRMGFLAEQNAAQERLVAGCERNLTKGYAKLDPKLSTKRLIKRWNLWVPDRAENLSRD